MSREGSARRKSKLFILSLLCLSLSLLIMTSTVRLQTHPTVVNQIRNPHPEDNSFLRIENPPHKQKKHSILFDFMEKEFKGRDVSIGLVNMNEGGDEEGELQEFGATSIVQFDRVQKELQWEDLFPEWIDEEEKWNPPSCAKIEMPNFKEYDEFDVVVSRVPCGSWEKREGIRDVFRLQVNLVVANLVVWNGRRNGDSDRPVYVVFIGYCGPMLEIFRCDDLLMHEGKIWIYRPELRRLKQKVLMPVGSCQLATPVLKRGQGETEYDFSKLQNPTNNPREAYVTVLHSSEAYVCGAIALAQSIAQTNSTKDLVLLADEYITKRSRRALKAAGWKIRSIERIRSTYAEKNSYNEWNYSKLRIWRLTQYDKVIFIDSDLILLQNIDNFFTYPQLSAVENDNVIFNSGMMLIEPSKCTFKMLMEKSHFLVSYNQGDQGFLNEAFTWWHRWPMRLNYLKVFEGVNETRRELPDSVRAVHYLGLKPWMCYRDYDCNWDKLDHHRFASNSAHRRWWQVYDAMPKKLRAHCVLTKGMDARLRKWRGRAEIERSPDVHWKIKVTDPRQHH